MIAKMIGALLLLGVGLVAGFICGRLYEQYRHPEPDPDPRPQMDEHRSWRQEQQRRDRNEGDMR